jgi:lipopolysaccharide biosynthesis regulator YciM
MKLKTFLYVLLGFLGFFGIVALFYANRLLLGERFIVWPERFLPLYAVLFIAFLAGFLLTLLMTLGRESRQFMARWREGRNRKETRMVEDLYSQGIEAMLDGRPGTALEHFRAVLSRAPRRVDALLKAGEVLRALGRVNDAMELHERARQAAPEDPRPLYELAADADVRDDSAAAKEYLGQIIRMNPRGAFSALRRLRDLHAKEGGWEPALEAAERLDKIRAAGDPEEAADVRTYLGIRYEIGARQAERGETRDAQNTLRRLLKAAPNFVPAWRKLGEVREQAGDEKGALTTWMEGYEKTRAPILLNTLEDHLLARENPEQAIEVCRHAIETTSPDTVPRFCLGKLFYRLEMLEEAMQEFADLKERTVFSPTLSFFMARIHERRGRHAEANECYRSIVREGRFLSSQYHCLTCQEKYDAWHERCAQCGEWNRIEVDFKEDLSLDDLGISTAPVYTAPGS